jgi:O-succinylbenzoate synthase
MTVAAGREVREIAFYDIAMRLRFRGQTRRQGVLLRGEAGWGEFSPFPDYPGRECGRWLAAAQEAAFDGWPRPLRDRIPVNTIVPAVAPQLAHELVTRSGCRTAKVKVAEPGQRLDDDVERVAAVRDALGSSGRLRVDANGAWSVEEAAAALTALNRYDLEYAEQPVASIEELAQLRRRVQVPIAADESIRRAEDPLRVARLAAADIVVLKVQPLGGVRRCLELADACGLPAVVSSAVETSVGIAAGVALAAALPELPYACGLGTVSLLAADVTSDPLLPVDGMLPVRPVEPDLISHDEDLPLRRHWEQRMAEAADASG